MIARPDVTPLRHSVQTLFIYLAISIKHKNIKNFLHTLNLNIFHSLDVKLCCIGIIFERKHSITGVTPNMPPFVVHLTQSDNELCDIHGHNV